MALLRALRSPSREPSEATLFARGVVAIAVLVLTVAGLYAYGQGAFADEWDAAALVDDAGGSLVAGSDVKYDGVVVGQVAALRADPAANGPGGTRIDLRLRPDVASYVPADVKARVLPASVFGTSFVDLVPSGVRQVSAGDALAPGAEIPQDRRRSTLELQDALDGLDEVVTSLGPAELARALDGLSGALDGNGAQLGRTIEQVERYLSRLNPAMPAVRRNLDLLATNLEAFEDYAPELFEATDHALVAARTLVAQEDDLRGLARSGARTMGDVDRLLTAEEQRLADALVRTAVTVDSLYDGRKPLTRGLLSFLDLTENFSRALSEGRYLRIRGDLVLREEPAYGAKDCPRYGNHRGRGC